MLYIIIELKDGTIVKGNAIEILKYRVENTSGPCFIEWTEDKGKMYKHEDIKTISVWVE